MSKLRGGSVLIYNIDEALCERILLPPTGADGRSEISEEGVHAVSQTVEELDVSPPDELSNLWKLELGVEVGGLGSLKRSSPDDLLEHCVLETLQMLEGGLPDVLQQGSSVEKHGPQDRLVHLQLQAEREVGRGQKVAQAVRRVSRPLESPCHVMREGKVPIDLHPEVGYPGGYALLLPTDSKVRGKSALLPFPEPEHNSIGLPRVDGNIHPTQCIVDTLTRRLRPPESRLGTKARRVDPDVISIRRYGDSLKLKTDNVSSVDSEENRT